MDRREAGSVRRALLSTLVALLVAALAAGVVYLASVVNHRRYRLAAHGGMLVIEQGLMLPAGYAPFEPPNTDLREAYQPIPMPPGATLEPAPVFDDRAELDRALFSLLSSWVRGREGSDDPEVVRMAVAYVQRLQVLAGISEEQRADLRTLRANLAYRRGRALVTEATARLKEAIGEFRMATELGAARATDAEQWAAELGRSLNDCAGLTHPGN